MKVKMIIVLTNCKCTVKICYKRVFSSHSEANINKKGSPL